MWPYLKAAVRISLFLLLLMPSIAFGERLQPSDLVYEGAFRLPEDFNWGARGASYYPAGNGGLGSLLITGQDQRPAEFAQVSIPSPATAVDWQELPEASLLSGMTEFDGNLIENQLDPTTTCVSGIEYVPQQGSQTGGKIYGSADWWYAVSVDTFPTIWFSEMDGSNPRGLYHVGPEADPFYGRKMGDYLFTLPGWYADLYVGGRTLVTGKCRGVPPQGSMGPTLFAFHPWKTEDPSGHLDAVPMLWYRALYPDCAGPNVGEKANCDYPDYTICDKWMGGSFVESGQKRAIILLGVKGLGSNRYGQPELGDCSQYQGYHCDPFERQVIFYDVEELAQVAQGNREPWSVLPYTIWRPQEFFNNPEQTCMEEGGVGGMTQDLTGQRIFMIERGLGEGQINAAVVHVWSFSSSSCPPCPSNGVITNAVYREGTTCTCTHATAITLGGNVTIESGATVTFIAPTVTIQSGFHAISGSTVTIRQDE